jgi:hypothetical protein
MAFSLSMPHTASAWADLPAQLIHSVRSLVAHPSERRIARPELTPEQRAHRIAMERLELQRGSASLGASGWPR